MTYEIRLKRGFFKTQPYYLTIASGQIILTPKELLGDKRLVIRDSDLTSICVTRTKTSGEIEIVTPQDTYVGHFVPPIDFVELGQVFTAAFGRKFALHSL